jgi:hypothetical protein
MANQPTPRPLGERVRERVHGNTSEAYVWLRAAYRRLRPRMEVRYPPYDEVAAEMVAAEVPGGRGAAVTGKAVRRIWERVCRDIELDAKARGKPAKAPPAGWKPQSAQSPAPAPVAASRPAPATTPRPAPVPVPRSMADITPEQFASLLKKPPAMSREEVRREIEATRAELRKRNE